MRYKIGDRVEDRKWGKGTIQERNDGYHDWIMKSSKDEFCYYVSSEDLTKIGETMSKYTELKERIEELDNGWDKDADDIANELRGVATSTYHLSLSVGLNNYVRVYSGARTKEGSLGKVLVKFEYDSQCEKNTAFKNALAWILDMSKFAKDHKKNSDKREKLQQQLDDIQTQLDNM